MTHTQARRYLARAERNGYVAYHKGIAHTVTGIRNGRELGYYGINIDGDGHDGRLFGCPELIWDAEKAEERFPVREYRATKEDPDAVLEDFRDVFGKRI